MMTKKPRIVIVGAGIAGITAANRLHKSPAGFDVTVVDGGGRIGGRIVTSEFGGDRVELGATWIHGIGGSPVHAIASEIGALRSEQPWECMDGAYEDPARLVTVAEGGFEPDRSVVDPVAELFKSLIGFAQGKPAECDAAAIAEEALELCGKRKGLSVGEFLRKGLSLYWSSKGNNGGEENGCNGEINGWTRKKLEEGVFRAFENVQRTYTSAGDLSCLDYAAESEYRMCSGEEITIAKGYSSVVEHLASGLPPGMVQLKKNVKQIEWKFSEVRAAENGFGTGSARPVKIHFCDGSTMEADHVIVTVSLGVLKSGLAHENGDKATGLLFKPALPSFKTEAIKRLGFGTVNKLFAKLRPNRERFPFLQMVFGADSSELRQEKVPWWMRRTAAIFPIYEQSNVLLSWYAGDEALELESLPEDAILDGVSNLISAFVGKRKCQFEVDEVLKTQWGKDPLFLGSYSYVAVGSSSDDFDRLAEPLPSSKQARDSVPELQILFAGEATHRTHYSTTHGAYFSGLREAERLVKHYECVNGGF